MSLLPYIQPTCESELKYSYEAIVCQSPGSGETEGIDYEDWVI
jgi:hypothetical protein